MRKLRNVKSQVAGRYSNGWVDVVRGTTERSEGSTVIAAIRI